MEGQLNYSQKRLESEHPYLSLFANISIVDILIVFQESKIIPESGNFKKILF